MLPHRFGVRRWHLRRQEVTASNTARLVVRTAAGAFTVLDVELAA